ncbi:MAG: hypothetical protein HZB34_04500 [Nitrospirae bacterium]|nr:hypothetical protein [Nitrospirota bacterium]
MLNVELSGLARRTTDQGPKFEVSGTAHPASRIPNFESRPSRSSRPSRLSQASAIAAEALVNNAG